MNLLSRSWIRNRAGVARSEEHVEASEPERLDAEKVTGDDRVGVRTQEVAPAELGASAGRRDAGLPQNLGDRRRRDAYADTGEFTDDPLVARRGFSRASRSTNARSSSETAVRGFKMRDFARAAQRLLCPHRLQL